MWNHTFIFNILRNAHLFFNTKSTWGNGILYILKLLHWKKQQHEALFFKIKKNKFSQILSRLMVEFEGITDLR